MELNFSERLQFSFLYPKEGSLLTQALVRDISEKVSLTQEELVNAEFKEIRDKENKNNIIYTWKKEKTSDKNIEFTEAELSLLKDQVKKLDKENKITQQIFDVCLKINKA